MRDKVKLLDLFRALFGERRTEHEYASIFFGVSARSQFSQFLNPHNSEKRHSERTVVKGIRRAMLLSWYDDDYSDKDIPSIDNFVDAVERIEQTRCDKFVRTFVKIATAICETCDDAIAVNDEKTKVLLKVLWSGECMLLSRSSTIDFPTMRTLSYAFEKASVKTLAAFPSLSECVKCTRSAALCKMGKTWNEAVARPESKGGNNLYDRRRSVLDVYSRISGRAVDQHIIHLFCGQRKRAIGKTNAKSN